MAVYYLAVDIGASSGRHILGYLEDGRIVLEEIYRFENGLVKKDGELCWEYDRLFAEIINGMKRCRELGKIPVSMGIDTWGVDFVLLDDQDQVIGNTVGYRDHRTDGMDEEVYKLISSENLYARTGIQKAIFNTIYQLMAIKKNHPEQLEQAQTLLHVPDYFHFLLTGNKTCEYTEATTGQLVSPVTKDWDYELIDLLGYPRRIFQKLIMPGTVVGMLSEKVKKEVGFDLQVVVPATHDTGSSVLSVPANDDDFIYISSGTWSLMGVERMTPDCSPRSRELNLTNEGGYAGRFRYLKNIMGLWMIQSVRHEYQDAYSFAQICAMAEEAKDFPSRVDANDSCFLSPDNMTEAVRDYCRRTAQPVPETLGELATVIYGSLADCYAKTAKELEEMGKREYHRIHIMGGGCNAGYLNELTARATGKEVHAGPTESTAIGNLLAQMLKRGEFNSIEEARTCVHDSFNIKVYNEKTLCAE
ncbi:MAG: rhamnulokinase [Lachnospiraceae bacterium]|nr:rhamnulokinase [Lachnospiraceae bacterium]